MRGDRVEATEEVADRGNPVLGNFGCERLVGCLRHGVCRSLTGTCWADHGVGHHLRPIMMRSGMILHFHLRHLGLAQVLLMTFVSTARGRKKEERHSDRCEEREERTG